MKLKKTPNYKPTLSKDMTTAIMCRYYAFMNAVKFVACGAKRRGIDPDSVELDSRIMKKYIDTVEGDIVTCLKAKGGIPLKYSLDPSIEESQNVTELQYV